MSKERYKYPRTYHLPNSIYIGGEDKRLAWFPYWSGKDIVITEKIDGEISCFSKNYFHARSIDGRYHESQSWARNLQASIAYLIPEGWRIYGENVYALHSIAYDRLSSYFYVIIVVDESNTVLSWDETKKFCEGIGLQTVPEYYSGVFSKDILKEAENYPSHFGEKSEGYVVRLADRFSFDDFSESVFKFVKSPVTSEEHWRSRQVVPNKVDACDYQNNLMEL